MRLSTHFTLAEAEFSDYALRHNINNKIPDEATKQKIALVAEHVLEPVRVRFDRPFSPTSWFRCKALNSAIGGAATSQHVNGEAVDIKIPGVSNFDIAHWVKDNIDFDQLILECWDGVTPTSGWVHVSFVGSNHRGSVLRYEHGSYFKGLPNA